MRPAALVLLGVGVCVAQGLYFHWLLDDAYITFVYARNWVHGQGVVFNAGQRVEGYTCFLWVALMAFGILLRLPVTWWATALGLLSAAGAVLGACLLAMELLPNDRHHGGAAAALFVGAYPPLAWWATSGMETALFTCLVTLALWRHTRDGAASVTAPLLLALASLTRPEAWLLAAILCADALWRGPRIRALRYVAVYAALFLPYDIWRSWYYGYPLPNTFYAKVGSGSAQIVRGLRYLETFLLSLRACVFVVLAAIALVRPDRRRTVLGAALLGYACGVVLVGGDVFDFARFFVPVVPLLGALAAAGLVDVAQRFGRPGAHVWLAASALALLAVDLSLLPAEVHYTAAYRYMMATIENRAEHFRTAATPHAKIATIAVGAVKFITDRHVIDMVGITDSHIAHRSLSGLGVGIAGHEKYDSDYVLAQHPDYIAIPQPGTAPLSLPSVDDMWRNPTFQRDYVPDQWGYVRKDLAPPSS